MAVGLGVSTGPRAFAMAGAGPRGSRSFDCRQRPFSRCSGPWGYLAGCTEPSTLEPGLTQGSGAEQCAAEADHGGAFAKGDAPIAARAHREFAKLCGV